MLILFWFNGSGGQRTERKIMDYPEIKDASEIGNHAEQIDEDVNNWKDDLNSHSEFQRWGWDENFSMRSGIYEPTSPWT